MTNPASKRASRRSRSSGFAWKSGLLATSVGAVLMGWALLARVDAPVEAAAQVAASQPRVIVVQVPIANDLNRGTAQWARQPAQAVQPGTQAFGASPGSAAQIKLPPMPQKPVFQRPVTRTRRS